jgi:hypothetical protein
MKLQGCDIFPNCSKSLRARWGFFRVRCDRYGLYSNASRQRMAAPHEACPEEAAATHFMPSRTPSAR